MTNKLTHMVILSCILLVVSSPALESNDPPSSYSIFDRIDEAYTNRQINLDMQMLYYAYAIRAESKLPDWIKENVNEEVYCVTPQVALISGNLERVSPVVKDEIVNLLYGRPKPVAGSVHSTKHPLIVHYMDAAWVEQAQTIVGYLDDAWDAEVDSWGFDPPPADEGLGGSDDYDCYLMDLQNAFGYQIDEGLVLSTPRYDSYGYIVFRQGLSPDMTKTYIAHEFQHSLQDGTDTAENIFLEMGATYAQGYVYPEITNYYSQLVDFQAYPHKSIYNTAIGTFEYGSFIFYNFLEDRYFQTPDYYFQMYNSTIQNKPTNSPELFDGIESLLSNIGESMENMWHEFTIWRLFTGEYADDYHFSRVFPYSPAIEATFPYSSLPVDDYHPTNPVEKAASSYIKIIPNKQQKPIEISITVQPDAQWKVSVLGFGKKSEPVTVLPLKKDENVFQLTLFDTSMFRYFFIALTNLGDCSYHGDENWHQGADYRVDIRYLDTYPAVNNFFASQQGNRVKIQWESYLSDFYRGFNLYKKIIPESSNDNTSDDSDYGTRINSSIIHLDGKCIYYDNDVHDKEYYKYTLTTINRLSSEIFCQTTYAHFQTPTSFSVSPAQPNPAHNSTRITYEIDRPAHVFFTCYDCSGRLVRKWDLSKQPPGQYTLDWDGNDACGKRVAKGVYQMIFNANNACKTIRIVIE